jgi:hypothetical protein
LRQSRGGSKLAGVLFRFRASSSLLPVLAGFAALAPLAYAAPPAVGPPADPPAASSPALASPAAPVPSSAPAVSAPPPPARPNPARAPTANEESARKIYRAAVDLFEAGDKTQALVEFQRAQELAPRPENLFMIAHCEYHLGLFKEARTHYQEFLSHESKGPLAETARQRIEAMNRRKAVIVIQASPAGVDIKLERLDTVGPPITGQAPNSFPVPAGRWRVTASKPNYTTETIDIDVDSVDTKPLFLPLERQLARVEITTVPANATLYVRGNRARNPYVQDVEPGSYEIYAEAPSYESRTDTFVLTPGERRKIEIPLRYVQRSGRPELIGFWTVTGAVGMGAAVAARLTVKTSANTESVTASATVMAGALMVGGVMGALGSTSLLPDYLPDNRALFRIGAAWIGAAEGATVGFAIQPTLASTFLGGALGLGVGAVTGTALDGFAPNYGRVAVIQSGAALGLLAGALAVPAMNLSSGASKPLVILGGLNLGLGAGLALSYLPDQTEYGPTWERVMLVDLAAGAGTLAGALIKIMGRCLDTKSTDCSFQMADPDRRQTARFALAGGALGLVGGWLLTRDFDRNNSAPLERKPIAFLPLPTMLPVATAKGSFDFVPALATQGRF